MARKPPPMFDLPEPETDSATKPDHNEFDRRVENLRSITKDSLEIMGEIGRGSFGVVYKVLHRDTGAILALKEISMAIDDKGEQDRLICELETLNDSNYEYLVNLKGVYFDKSRVHVAMEYMDAGSLRDMLDKSKAKGLRIPEPVLGKIASAMLNGMNYLKKEKNVMHRDIKPDNVLVSRSGSVKLCDLGISKKLEGSIARTNIGTTLYLSPERIDPTACDYNVTADVWSFGIALMELARGVFPYEVDSNMEFLVLSAIVEQDPPRLRTEDGWSEEFAHFIAHTLVKDPRHRPRPWDLLTHPFILYWNEAQVDMAAWVASVLE
eukprot:c8353_g1_i1.p1 GENE.c8353_g1_i1~~c8353_g1_i1.p1  ORF type:complete len:323 (-),score=63.25 c8353_g1_i1:76-1044(-)